MDLSPQQIADLECINPTIMQGLKGVMPGVDVILRDDIVLISSKDFPSADTNLAYLFRTTPEKADALIEEMIEYFQSKDLTPQIMVSPACSPADLPERLLARGFVCQEAEESWMMFTGLQKAVAPKIDRSVTVKRVESADVTAFAQVMAGAFEMPAEWVPYLAQMLEPTLSVPGFTHYLASVHGTPAATLTLMRHNQYATIGSGGVLPEFRGTRTIYNMAVEVLSRAQRDGVDIVLGQTTLGPKFERFLRIGGFKLAFKRTGFKLE
jgi:hypothetical protein